jgi:hypothetical protein
MAFSSVTAEKRSPVFWFPLLRTAAWSCFARPGAVARRPLFSMHALAPTMPADLQALFQSLGIEARGERPRSERVLERLLDLQRCVNLGGVLDAPQPAESIEPLSLEQPELARVRLLEGKLLAGWREMRVRIDQRFESAFAGINAAPDAVALHALLLERIGTGANGATAAAAARTIAAHLAPRYVAVIGGVLRLILGELSARQSEMRQVLQQGNSEMRRLAALDRVLDGVFRAELELCCTQLQTALGATLEKQLHAACASLAEGASVDGVRPWFGPHGCIGRFLRDGRRVCHALLDREWSALMGLQQAAANSAENDES